LANLQHILDLIVADYNKTEVDTHVSMMIKDNQRNGLVQIKLFDRVVD